MSTVLFIRHGQAGTRDNYDHLSALGKEQSASLGRWLVKERMRFDLAVIGGLERQRETAEIVLASLAAASFSPPRIETDPRWNEFDLEAITTRLAPLLSAGDPTFRSEWEQIQDWQRTPGHHVNRHWTAADSRIVHAWIEGRYEAGIESWPDFNSRVLAAGAEFSSLPAGARVAVFTSAAPVSIWIARIFGNHDAAQILKLAGAQLNTNLTEIGWRNGQPSLASFNSVPHLAAERLRTLR